MKKYAVTIQRHRTSISLEPAFWTHVQRIARDRNQSIAALVTDIDAARGAQGLSSAIRLFVLKDLERGRRD